jgi:hypothetical protein
MDYQLQLDLLWQDVKGYARRIEELEEEVCGLRRYIYNVEHRDCCP